MKHPLEGVFSEVGLLASALEDYGLKLLSKRFIEPAEYDPMPSFLRSTMEGMEESTYAMLCLKMANVISLNEISEEVVPLSFCLEPNDNESGQIKILYLALKEFQQTTEKRFKEDRDNGELTKERAGYYEKQRKMIKDCLRKLENETDRAQVPLSEILQQDILFSPIHDAGRKRWGIIQRIRKWLNIP